MSWLTFSILVLLTLLAGFLIVRYWLQIIIIYYVLQIIIALLLFPAIITFVWYFCKGITVGNLSFEGWEKTYSYWIIFYLIAAGVYVGIAVDVIKKGRKLVEKYL